jgi:hypothetical protein
MFIQSREEGVVMHLNQTKRLFQLSLITLFISILVLGVAATDSAGKSIPLDGKISGKIYCDDGSANAEIMKIKNDVQIFYEANDPSPPDTKVSTTVISPDIGILIFTGLALFKNKTTGTFLLHGSDSFGADIEYTMAGNFKNDKNGFIKQIGGKVHWLSNHSSCFSSLKFKAKRPPKFCEIQGCE